MRTSERVEKLAEALRAVMADLRRLEVDLPPADARGGRAEGRTAELVDYVATRVRQDAARLDEEAAQLRRWND